MTFAVFLYNVRLHFFYFLRNQTPRHASRPYPLLDLLFRSGSLVEFDLGMDYELDAGLRRGNIYKERRATIALIMMTVETGETFYYPSILVSSP